MTWPERPPRVAVLGGGVAGLAAAHRLVELSSERALPLEVTLLEASGRLGGVVSTLRRDGFLIEEGPDSIITDKPWARALAERIGLAGRITGTQEEFRRSFVVRRRRLVPTPEGFYMLAPGMMLPFILTPLFSPLGKLRMAMDLVIPASRSEADESVGDFVLRRLGRQALERIAQPMVAGVYGADPFHLSLKATLPRFRAMEREHGSLIRAMMAGLRRRSAAPAAQGGASGPRYSLFISFDGGLQTLTDALAARLPAGCARTGARVDRLSREAGGWRVAAGALSERFDAVILALPAWQAAPLVRPHHADLAARLDAVPCASAATVTLAFRQGDVAHPLDGFGFVAPAIEGLSVLGCTFFHRKYAGRAPGGHALLRAFWGRQSESLDDARLVQATLSDLDGPLGLKGKPLFAHVARWPRAMPRYDVGHLDHVDLIERDAATLPGLGLAGNGYRGVGIPDCVHSGEQAAERILSGLLADAAGSSGASHRPTEV